MIINSHKHIYNLMSKTHLASVLYEYITSNNSDIGVGNDMSFKNKVVLITGGSAGIGATAAELFAKGGAKVVIVARDQDKLNLISDNCQKNGALTLTIKADVSKDDEADTIIKKTIDKFGQLDVLVNNAGILRQVGILDDNFLVSFDEIMNINLRGVARITYFAAPHLINTKGNIVNISSVDATCVQSLNNIAYKTSKAALNHFTRCVALELASYGVRVNSISPGQVRTGFFKETQLKTVDALINHTALQQVSDTGEIADLIVYVASDKAKGITGSNFVIDNGMALL